MKLSLWKRLKFFFIYRKLIKLNKTEIQQYKFQFEHHELVQPTVRVDNVFRLYTVVNLPDDIKTYMSGDIAKKYIQDYIRALDSFLNSKGFNELIGIRDIKQLDESHYLIVFGYSHLDTAKLANWSLLIGSILILLSTFLYFFKLWTY